MAWLARTVPVIIEMTSMAAVKKTPSTFPVVRPWMDRSGLMDGIVERCFMNLPQNEIFTIPNMQRRNRIVTISAISMPEMYNIDIM
jgi:hypothetical protein